MSKKSKNVVLLVVVLVVVAIASTMLMSSKNQTTSTNNNANEVIKLGYIGPLTGPASILGIEASQAIDLAVEQANAQGGVNGKKIELFIEDDQYDTSKAVTAYNKLVNQNGVETIVMSTYGGVFAVAQKAKNDGVLVVDSLDCDQNLAGLSDNVFCIAKETKDLADVIADYAVEKGYKNIGILHSTTDNFMPSVATLFEERVGNSIKVQKESYTADTSDFKTSLLKLKDKDAIVYLGYQEIGIAIKQARGLGITSPMLSIPSVATDPAIQESSAGKINGMYFSFYAPLNDNNVATDFYNDYNAKFERKPIVYVATDHAYDSANILLEEVLPKVKSETKAERLQEKIEAMEGVKNYKGVSGTLNMGDDGRIKGILIRLFKLTDLVPEYVQQ
ncbi:MAG: ABC transporter substrate-binding protein [Parcubacteria group bacterium]|jgi:branched-chain amino acid transport system substrate-binding protein